MTLPFCIHIPFLTFSDMKKLHRLQKKVPNARFIAHQVLDFQPLQLYNSYRNWMQQVRDYLSQLGIYRRQTVSAFFLCNFLGQIVSRASVANILARLRREQSVDNSADITYPQKYLTLLLPILSIHLLKIFFRATILCCINISSILHY